MEEYEVRFSLIFKPKVNVTNTTVSYFQIKIKDMLNEYNDIIVNDLPNELTPMRRIRHHIDFIPGENIPNKVAYRMTPQESEEIGKQVQGLLDKGLIKKSLSPCVDDTMFTPKKDVGWGRCTKSRAINNITIGYMFP